jgi:hypothetical protein
VAGRAPGSSGAVGDAERPAALAALTQTPT